MALAAPAPQPPTAHPTQGSLCFNLQRHCLTVSEDLQRTCSFDGEGRLIGSY